MATDVEGAKSEEMTVKEAADYSGMGISTLSLYAKNGTIQARKIGHMWLIQKAALDAYLATPHKPGIKKGTKRKPAASTPHQSLSLPDTGENTQTEDAA